MLTRRKIKRIIGKDKSCLKNLNPKYSTDPRNDAVEVGDMVASCSIVFVDPKMLNPVLWRTLPKELLLLVLARLPVLDITRLRCLSREWRKDMATMNS